MGAATTIRRTFGEVAAIAQVLLCASVAVAAADRRSVLSSPNHGAFTGWFAGPLRGLVPRLTRDPHVLERNLHHALLAMFVAWLVLVFAGGTVRPSVIVGAVVAANAVFLLCPPTALTDLFNYLGYARLDAVHHLDPYVQLPLAQRGDPVYAYSNWHHLRSPYGPLFTVLLLPPARLSLPAAYWTYKAIVTVASLGLLAAVWGCARRLGRSPTAAVAFVGLNPLVLVYALGGKHNDALMMAILMAGCLLVAGRREPSGGALLAAAVAIKASAGLLAPVVAAGAPRRWRAIAGALAGAVVLVTVTVGAFGPHAPDVADQARLVNPYSVPNVLGYALGHGGADASVRRGATIAAALALGVCAAVAWRTRRWVTAGGVAGLVALASVSWLMPWYVLWPLPFAALSRSRALRAATIAATAWLLLVRVGTTAAVAHHFGIDVRATAVARANARFAYGLLRN
ncbi:MAG TPA: glycosyltransferase 87 family protein [Solirubrobacteraceae bacterium]|nr:glycosyltransferase 87 family protein [Solirubrobacteraceae bacterium]